MALKSYLRIMVSAIALLGACFVTPTAFAQSATTIDEIVVSGNQRVSTATILSYLPISLGE